MSATNRGAKRQENDDYPTPPSAVHRLLEGKNLPGGLWIEPCSGEGAIIKAVNSVRSDVVWLANEYNSTYENALRTISNVSCIRIGDARTMFLDGVPSVVITNPPFNISEELLRHFLLISPKSLIVFLQRLNWAENKRSALFRQLRPSVYVLPQRPSFRDVVSIDLDTGKKRVSSTDATAYAWFVFDNLGEFAMLNDTPDEVRKAEKVDRRRKVLDSKNGIVVETPSRAEEEIAIAQEKESELQENRNSIEGEANMAWLPPGMSKAVAEAEAFTKGSRAKDGDYVFMHLGASYESTKKGNAVIIEHQVVSAAKVAADVEPNAVGTTVTYFLPDYGEAKVMLNQNLKLYTCGLLGVDPKTVAASAIQETIDALGNGLARGMYIRGVTFHTNKKDGEDFTGFNWYPVEGENKIDAVSVIKRKAELDKAKGTAPATPGAATAPAAPGNLPPAPPPPNTNLLDGWTPNPSNPDYVYRYVNGQVDQRAKADVLAGR